jgi:hypothetical protein
MLYGKSGTNDHGRSVMASSDVDDRRRNLEALCRQFFIENKIYDAETICGKDSVIVNAFDFMCEIGDIIGYEKRPKDEDDDDLEA